MVVAVAVAVVEQRFAGQPAVVVEVAEPGCVASLVDWHWPRQLGQGFGIVVVARQTEMGIRCHHQHQMLVSSL